MPSSTSLTASRRGAWIINISKHLSKWDPTDPGLMTLDNILFAGKAGSLLIKLSADDPEELTLGRVRAHARFCGINPQELDTYLEALKNLDCIDWDLDKTTFEVLAFSRQRVLTTSSTILEGTPLSAVENALPAFLEYCLLRPRLTSEVKSHLSSLLSEKEVNEAISLVTHFELLGVSNIEGHAEKLFFNGYQFGDRALDIGKALASLPPRERSQLNELLEAVQHQPGMPPEDIKVPEQVKVLAIGLGLVEESEVSSMGQAGRATFLTTPMLSPPSVGQETGHLEDDVFDHAKMLLSSLRYGELRSTPGRGRIVEPPVLVNALLNRDHIGPCTAIGQDYVLLEAEGVIKTTPAYKAGQFYMELRRREPAEMVLGLLRHGNSATIDAKSLPRSLELPGRYTGPDWARPRAARRATASTPELMHRFLEELRT